MRAAVIVFPGSNCDRDLAVAFEQAGFQVEMVWHKDAALPEGIDIVGVPGGFSYGDYLRCGAIAAREARLMGGGEVEISVSVKRIDIPGLGEDVSLVAATVTAEVVSAPDT